MTEIKDQMLEDVNGGTSYWSFNDACDLFEAIDPNAKNNQCRHCRYFEKIGALGLKCDGICRYSHLKNQNNGN